MNEPIIIDVETQFSFREQKNFQKLRVSVAGVYNYKDDTINVYEEKELSNVFRLFENALCIVGFNIKQFDLPVLSRYYPGNIFQFKYFDMLEDLKSIIGRRLGLDDFVRATLGRRKTGHGIAAIELFREGKIEDLKKYCENDVLITKELFDFGVKNGYIEYFSSGGKKKVQVSWKRKVYFSSRFKRDISLSLPF